MNKITLDRIFLIFAMTALAVIVAIHVADPNFFTNKITGTFEYVRKGEELLDAGRYLKAIFYFEKACESSPDNKMVKLSLVYAYSQYGRALAEKEDYDSAIGYLTRAYKILPDTDTIKNLALLYSQKTLAEMRNGNWQNAREYFKSARAAVEPSQTATRVLATALYRDAIEEYRAGREDIAILCLKESLIMREEKRTLELLGDIYYKQMNLETASFYWNRAKNIDPENKAIIDKLEKVDKELKHASDTQKKVLPHFELRYDKELGLDTEAVKELLEEAYNDIGKDLVYFPSSKITISFYSWRDFVDIFRMPIIVQAFYDGNIRIPVPGKGLNKKELRPYIYHEYTHAAVMAVTNGNCPNWFSEGMAVWEEYKGRREEVDDIVVKIVPGVKFSIDLMTDVFRNGVKDMNIANKGIDIGRYYMVSYTMVRYILDNWGLSGLRNLLKRMAKGQHIVNAIDDEFLLSEREFDRRWSAYVHKTYVPK